MDEARQQRDVPATMIPPPDRRTRWGWVAAIVAIVVTIGTIGFFVMGRTTDASAEVRAAADLTVGEHTAQLTYQGTVQTGPDVTTMRGTGQIDFSAKRMKLFVTYGGTAAPPGQNLQLVTTDPTVYEGGSVLAPLLANNKAWVGVAVAGMRQSISSTSTVISPLALMAILRQEGGTVTSMGSSSIAGVRVQRYVVVPSLAATKASIERSSLPAAQKTAALQLLSDGPTTFTAAIDEQGRLRWVAASQTVSTVGVPTKFVYSMGFSHFNQPVSIAVPDPSTVCMATVSTIPTCLNPAASGSASPFGA